MWYDEFEPLLRTDLIFVLSAPLDVISRRHFHLVGDGALRLVHEPANVAASHAHQHAASQQSILGADHGWSHHHTKVGHLS